MVYLLFMLLVLGVASYFVFYKKKKAFNKELLEFPPEWKTILNSHVVFYHKLNELDKIRFEQDVANFLKITSIVGRGVEVDTLDRLLIASSAVIPIFGFPEWWYYKNLDEVILLPSHFDRNLNCVDPQECITGMVGDRIYEGKMFLSRPALRHGFSNNQDKKNVGIHEFIHILDKEDDVIDGVPFGFEDKSFALPWMMLVRDKIKEIRQDESDIRKYGGLNNQEFFAVASEYFFEQPRLLKKKHPKLYEKLAKVFKQKPI